jgi:hypothetical protein
MLFSAKAEITLPKEDNEVLINFASSNLRSTEFDFFTLSEPAKSINDRVELIYYVLDIFWVT